MQNRYHELDSLRGLAAFTVVICHCLIAYDIFYASLSHEKTNNILLNIFTYTPIHILWAGHEAVILFFVLSGFVLSLPFLNLKDYSYSNYITKRVCRIYLPYISSVFVSVLLHSVISQNETLELSTWFRTMWSTDLTIKNVISYVLMLGSDTHNINTVSWSLVHEMRISLFFPLLMIVIMKFNWKKSLIYGTLISIVPWIILLFISESIDSNTISYLFNSFSTTFYYSLFFVFGALFAKYRDTILSKVKDSNIKVKLILTLLFLILYTNEWTFPIIGTLKASKTGYQLSIINTFNDCLIAFSVLILFALALSSFRFNKILNLKVFLYLGKISYSLYLIHVIVLLTFLHLTQGKLTNIATFFFVPVFSIIIASLMYKYIELPSIGLGKKITSRKIKHASKKAA